MEKSIALLLTSASDPADGPWFLKTRRGIEESRMRVQGFLTLARKMRERTEKARNAEAFAASGECCADGNTGKNF